MTGNITKTVQLVSQFRVLDLILSEVVIHIKPPPYSRLPEVNEPTGGSCRNLRSDPIRSGPVRSDLIRSDQPDSVVVTIMTARISDWRQGDGGTPSKTD